MRPLLVAAVLAVVLAGCSSAPTQSELDAVEKLPCEPAAAVTRAGLRALAVRQCKEDAACIDMVTKDFDGTEAAVQVYCQTFYAPTSELVAPPPAYGNRVL